jgi:DNA-binding response OmpR family regulator
MNDASSTSGMPGSSRFGRFEILTAERRLHVDGQPVALGSRAFDLLAALVARRDRIVPKDELIEVVWPGLVVEENNLQVQISALRKVLGAQAIATVPGRGYQFTAAASAAPQARASAALASPQSRMHALASAATVRGSRLLVADDNKVNRLLLCRSLELMGHEVASADNGLLALDKLRSEHFDLLLLDLEMPEMDGFALLELLAADPALRELPVIVTSSVDGAAAVARCIELGAEDFLHKPVNPVLLKARVDSSLERKALRDRERELLARLAHGLPDSAQAASAAWGGQRGQATVLVVRLLDVDRMAPLQPAQETLELLSDWSTLMLAAIEGHGGRVTQRAGDSICAVFGAPDQEQDAGATMAAAQTALETMALLAQFNAERRASGKASVESTVGLASGEVVAGACGTPRRAAYVCVGAPVDRATRLAALAAQPGRSILIDGVTRAAMSGRIGTEAVQTAALPDSPTDGPTDGPTYALKAG